MRRRPEEQLPAAVALLLLCSLACSHAQVLLSAGTTWRYYDKVPFTDAKWRAMTYVDTAWASGRAPLGYGLPPSSLNTTIKWGVTSAPTPRYVASYYRTRFNASPTPLMDGNVTLTLFVDDGAVVSWRHVASPPATALTSRRHSHDTWSCPRRCT
jgi:hypothetical protein